MTKETKQKTKLTKEYRPSDEENWDVFFNDHVAKHIAPNSHSLVVGSKIYEQSPKADRRELYPKSIGCDLFEGDGVDRVMDLTSWGDCYQLTLELGKAPFDHIDCVSVMEHCERPWKMAENIEYLLKPGGTFFISVPFVWRIHAYPSDFFRYTPEGIKSLFPEIEWKKLELMSNGRVMKKNPVIESKGVDFFARTEVCGFGVRA